MFSPNILNLIYKVYVLQHIVVLLKFFEFFFKKKKKTAVENLPEWNINHCRTPLQQTGLTQQNEHAIKKMAGLVIVLSIVQPQGKRSYESWAVYGIIERGLKY